MTLLAALAIAGPAGAATRSVNIFAAGFSPKSITDHRRRHGHVDEQGHDREPPDARGKGEFVSPILHHNNSFSFTFKAAGTFNYSDELHPKLTGDGHRQGVAADS